jgi:uncharacterized damage-inducible protein DinB
MNKRDIELLIDYNYWANRKILDRVTQATDPEFVVPQPPGFSAGSLRGTLVHAMSAEWVWRMRLQHGVSPTAHLNAIEFPNLSALILRWGTEEARMREYAEGVHDELLAQEVRYTSFTGEARVSTVEHALTHVVLHGMQHRAECAVILTNLGHSPGNIDLLYYLIEKGIP